MFTCVSFAATTDLGDSAWGVPAACDRLFSSKLPKTKVMRNFFELDVIGVLTRAFVMFDDLPNASGVGRLRAPRIFKLKCFMSVLCTTDG